MLQKMRDQTQSLAFKVLVAILVVVLAIFGFGAFNLFVTGEPEVATVNGEGITQSELAAATERESRRLAAQMGEDFDPSLIDPVRLQGAVLDQLIARYVMQQGADELGIGVSRERVDELLVSNANFQVDGQFQPDLYRQTVRSLGYTPQSFLEETTQMMALQQLQESLLESAFLTRSGLNFHARLLGQRRDVAYLPFDVDRFRDRVEVTDEEVRLRYEENERAYMTEESVDVAYVAVDSNQVAADGSIEISDEELESAYQAEREAAPPEQQRRSRHILLETGDERSADEAAAELQAIKQRVQEGASFADIAREVSEDPGSASQGGDLGFAGRGIFDPAFEEALFALEEPGDLSEPVQTEFGYHLIQLEEIRNQEFPTFDAMRADLEQRLRRERAGPVYEERVQQLDSLAFENPNDLQAIEEQLGLEVRTVEGVTRQQGPPPFDDPAVLEQLFTGEVLDRGYNSPAVRLDDGRAIVMRVIERHPPELVPFEDVADDIRNEIEAERASTLAQEAFQEARSRLEAGESSADVAASYDSNWQTFEDARRTAADIPAGILQSAFSLPRPVQGGKSIGEAALPGGGLALVTVTRVQDGQVDALTQAELEGMRSFLASRTARLEFSSFYETLRAEASIERVE